MFTLRYSGGDPVLASDGKQWGFRHAQTARREATTAASEAGRPVQIMRGARVAYVMHPDGTTRAPEGSIEPDRATCTKDSGKACFCIPCREERKAARR